MSKDKGIIYKFGYPPYQIIINQHNKTFFTSGGGGSSKTGVPNEMELFEYPVLSNDSLNKIIIKNVAKFSTENVVVMNMDGFYNYVATAQNNNIKEYITYKEEIINDENLDKETKIRDRRKSESEQQNEHKQELLQLKTYREIKNVFPIDDEKTEFAEVKCVRYGGKWGDYLIAGSTSGCVKIFKRFNDDNPMTLSLIRTINDVSGGACDGIFDLDVCPVSDEIVAICERKSGRYAQIWSILHGTKLTELALTSQKGFDGPKEHDEYKFQHCRYLRTGIRPNFMLFCTHISTKDRKLPAFLSVWGPLDSSIGTDYQFVSQIKLGYDTFDKRKPLKPTALAVSITSHMGQTGCLAGIGSGEGQVDVYRFLLPAIDQSQSNYMNSNNRHLKLIYRLTNAHSFFITDLKFIQNLSSINMDQSEFSLISIGIDNMLRIHNGALRKPQYSSYKIILRLFYFILALFVIDRLILLISNL